jgi:hypothetical protein
MWFAMRDAEKEIFRAQARRMLHFSAAMRDTPRPFSSLTHPPPAP